jgi:anti-anti-sigma factor
VVTGRLDANNAHLFEQQTAPLLTEKHQRILLDLSGLTYVSSAGLRAMIRIVKHTSQQGGRTGIFAVSPHILELMEISGFETLIDIFPDRETALIGSPR